MAQIDNRQSKINNVIEPELLQAPPRKAVLRDPMPLGGKIGCGVFLAMIIAVGLVGIAWAISRTSAQATGVVTREAEEARILLIAAVVWNVLVLGGVALFIWGRGRFKRLVTHGKPVIGRITDKKEMMGRSYNSPKSYFLHYAFQPETGAHGEVKNREHVSEEQFNSIQVGDPVTVVYIEGKPKSNGLYRFGLYRVE